MIGFIIGWVSSTPLSARSLVLMATRQSPKLKFWIRVPGGLPSPCGQIGKVARLRIESGNYASSNLAEGTGVHRLGSLTVVHTVFKE